MRERLEPLRDALRPFSFISLHPYYFMHVTLLFAGFLVEEAEADNEISRERLEEIEANARLALSDFPAFIVRLANLNAFLGPRSSRCTPAECSTNCGRFYARAAVSENPRVPHT